MKRYLFLAVTLVVVVVAGVETGAVVRTFWTLDFTHTGLHYVNIGGRAVAYTTYTVTNNTGADRVFTPIFRVETETGKLTYAMPSPAALQAIRSKHGKKLLDINEVTGVLKNGETRLGAAIIYNLDPYADHVKLYITGLTDGFRYQDEDNRKGFQRKVRFVHWFRPGDELNRPEDRIDTLFDDWIWRSTGTAGTAPEEE